MKKKIGEISFVLGVVLAVIIGLLGSYLEQMGAWIISLLIVLGLIVGFVNVTRKQTKDFVLMAVALVLVSYAGGASGTLTGIVYMGDYLAGVFNALMAFVVPAVVVVILKEIYALAKS
jgi:hypothetical protein